MDSTGVAHILEHTALCGSRRFPVRDPFFKMLTRSLATFMNAFTGVYCVIKTSWELLDHVSALQYYKSHKFYDAKEYTSQR